MSLNLKKKKLLRAMEFNREYTVAELYELSYNEKGSYNNYDIFYLLILSDMELDKKIIINHDNTWTIKRVK